MMRPNENRPMKTHARALLFACIGASVSCPALAVPQGFEWFPRVPGPDDPLYLLPIDPCHSTQAYAVSLDNLEASFLTPESGALAIRYETFLAGCIGAPPVVHAVAIPQEIDGAPVDGLFSTHVRSTPIFENGQQVDTVVNEIEWFETLPPRVAIPPSVSGTWFSPAHVEQGILINMTAKRELLVGWTTYGADGTQRWFSGIAPTVPDESTVTLTLTDTGDGAFAGELPNDAAPEEWGTLTIEYVACGEIEVSWNPKTTTGLQPGSATMQQLTQPHDAACDIEAYAAALGQPLTIHELDIETAPQPVD